MPAPRKYDDETRERVLDEVEKAWMALHCAENALALAKRREDFNEVQTRLNLID